MRGDLEAGFQAFVDNYKKWRPSPLHCPAPDCHRNQRGDLREHERRGCPSLLGLSLLAYPWQRASCWRARLLQVRGYVPGRHGNQRGHNQSAQHSPVKPTPLCRVSTSWALHDASFCREQLLQARPTGRPEASTVCRTAASEPCLPPRYIVTPKMASRDGSSGSARAALLLRQAAKLRGPPCAAPPRRSTALSKGSMST